MVSQDNTKLVNFNAEIFRKIGALADEMQLPCYAVGGFVRDSLLQRKCKDIDIMVVGEPIAFAKAAKTKLNGFGFAVFERFRTARLSLKDREMGEIELEFVGARKESYSPESRKPITEVGTLQDDLSRRDFTINALAVSLNQATFGKLTDLFNGRNDLSAQLLRTPLEPESTFSDDPLRMMRAARFASQLNFNLEPEIFVAMQNMHRRIGIVSKERVRDELFKIMASPKPSVGLDILYKTGVLKEILPELTAMAGVEQIDGVGHKDTFYHTLKVVDNISEMSEKFWLRMAALFHDVGKPKTKRFKEGHGWTFHGHDAVGAAMMQRIFRKQKFPLDHLEYVQKLIRLHLRPIPLSGEEITDSAIRRLMFEAGEELDDLMMLCRADVTSKNPQKVEKIMSNFLLVEEKVSQVCEKDLLAKWRPPINGVEIMEMFNLSEGKIVGLLKKSMENAIIDGVIPYDKEAAMRFLNDEFQKINDKN
ncbi:polynucleotide adenylyltransferase/metal dependent phosphohydrolase [Chloroherpeton thalassium ATCC 35110]|uniref:Polynucleotide adenylyltransferase/metal dependent phosphohydrolase n=1 Tax=Chloroherpeton thalassium (strain ATCC 35110 / GB-78) TaxID=517418 RepID=B3QZ74_CHLT3|nr:CCA tRNA nucleotidyltransferase [Chloroherpeton thalassium]ACF13767.1 polynucleotide adenylyltransferase/metal dependent phosphohydrolase [Chloroherpeton thalassium ATCC 35110]